MTDNPRQNVTFPSNGSQAHGYLATPASGNGPGVIVIQEWWGLTDHIADVSDRLAGEGFVALAPDLFGGKVAHDADEAMKLLTELPVDRAARDLSGAVDYLLGLDSVTPSEAAGQGHYAEQDTMYPIDDAKALETQIREEAGVPVEFFYYPAGHAFHNDE